MYWWKEFDSGEVKDEWSHIKEMGFTHIRFFLLWEDFQPAPDRISIPTLNKLSKVLDIAQALGLKVQVSLLTGNMSGLFWLPDWVSRNRKFNLFEDREVVQAENLLLQTVAQAIGKHPALHSWDLCNELDQINQPRSARTGREWMTRLAKTLHSHAPNLPVTYGTHYPSFVTKNGLRLDHMGQVLDIVSVHAWSVYFPVSVEPFDLRTVVFTFLLASWLAGKAVFIQELGLPTSPGRFSEEWINDDFLGQKKKIYLASEEGQAHFIEQSIIELKKVGCPGVFLWCYADYDQSIWNRPPLDRAKRERFFGIIRSDGSEKPVVEILQKTIRLKKNGQIKRISDAHRRFPAVNPDQYYKDPSKNFQRFWESYSSGSPIQ